MVRKKQERQTTAVRLRKRKGRRRKGWRKKEKEVCVEVSERKDAAAGGQGERGWTVTSGLVGPTK